MKNEIKEYFYVIGILLRMLGGVNIELSISSIVYLQYYFHLLRGIGSGKSIILKQQSPVSAKYISWRGSGHTRLGRGEGGHRI